METNEIIIEQRSDEWHELRAGRTTASSVTAILGKITHKKTLDAIENFAFQKAREILFEREEEKFIGVDAQNGVELEPFAFKKLAEILALDHFLNLREAGFFANGEFSGSSPDGIVEDMENKPVGCAEIKCPKHAKFLKIVIGGIEAIEQKWIDQMQKQMLDTDTDVCYFLAYCVSEGNEYYHLIEIKRDNERIELIKERVEMVTNRTKEIIKSVNQNKQY